MVRNIQVRVQHIHANILSMSIDNEDIGYLFIDEQSEDKTKRIAVVKNNGENIGSYCCERCATNAAVKAHFNLDEDYIVTNNDPHLDLLRKLFIASLLSDMPIH